MDDGTLEKVAKKWYNKLTLKQGVMQMLFQKTEKTELKKILNDSLPKELVAV